MNYLDFYNKCLPSGDMRVIDYGPFPYTISGLCDHFRNDLLFDLVCPTPDDIFELIDEGKSDYCWGSDSPEDKFHIFTPLRQNIVLLMAAMAGEL